MPHDTSLRLLLIEDNPGDARYIRELLSATPDLSRHVRGRGGTMQHIGKQAEQTAPTVLHETHLGAGIERLADENIDVVLLDLNLPDSNGLETLLTMLDQTDAPVVVLTGVRDRETGIDALHQGADEYLVKDEINSDLLLRSIYHAIERKAHERELKRYETLIEESTDVNAILKPDGTLLYITPSVKRVLGYDPDELIGTDGFTYIHPDDRTKAKRALKNVVEEKEYSPVEFRFKHVDDSWAVLESRSRNLLDDPLVNGIVVYTRDITERKEREQQLERFSSVVSHDLRNPLAIAKGYLQMAEKDGDPADFAEVKQAHARMETIIQNLLTMTQTGQTITTPESVSFASLVENAWQHVETMDATVQITVTEGTVVADADRLQTAFENLFRNAVEHGGHDVTIRVGWLTDGFYIEDTGMGIPESCRSAAFDYGYSGGNGTGIGLAVVREIIDAHGWTITVTESSSGGARFEIHGVEDSMSNQ